MTKKQFLKATVFLLLFVMLFIPVNRVFSRPLHDYNYQMISGFYEEPEDSLDAVYVGSSNCFMFFNPLFAWDEYGIAVYNYACDAFPFEATRFIIEEARKTQPDALFLVNLNTLHDSVIGRNMTHYLLDNMPMNRNRIALTEHLANTAGWDYKERMQYYFPILRFHSRWSELQMNDFGFALNGIKGTSTFIEYVGSSSDITSFYHRTTESTVPNDWMMGCVNDLLDYCDEKDVNILFVIVPRAEKEATTVSQLNYVESYIEERGYPVLSMIQDPEAIGLNLATDFYNKGHSNIHGSLKITRHIGQYLVDNYGFTDKRGDEAYASWTKARSKYESAIRPHVLDFEFSAENRDYTLSAPKRAAAVLSGETVCLTWDPVSGAEGYQIYRRLNENAWELLGDTADMQFTDAYAGENKAPLYRIVPYRLDDTGAVYYGCFLPQGIPVTVE